MEDKKFKLQLLMESIGAIELIPKRLFYDYKAKYTKKQKQNILCQQDYQKKI